MNLELYIDLLEKEVAELRLCIQTSELEHQLAAAEARERLADTGVVSHSGRVSYIPSADKPPTPPGELPSKS